MALIPVVEIPNAPMIEGVGPVQRPDMPVAQLQQTMANMADAVQQEQLNPEAFMGEARGLQAIGAAVGDAAETFTKIAVMVNQERSAKIDTQVNDNMNSLQMDIEEYKSALSPDMDPDQARAGFVKLVKNGDQRISAAKLDPIARQKLQIEYNRLKRVEAINMNKQVQQQLFTKDKTALSTKATHHIRLGDADSAISTYGIMRDKGYIHPEEYEALAANAPVRVAVARIDTEIAADPYSVMQRLGGNGGGRYA